MNHPDHINYALDCAKKYDNEEDFKKGDTLQYNILKYNGYGETIRYKGDDDGLNYDINQLPDFIKMYLEHRTIHTDFSTFIGSVKACINRVRDGNESFMYYSIVSSSLPSTYHLRHVMHFHPNIITSVLSTHDYPSILAALNGEIAKIDFTTCVKYHGNVLSSVSNRFVTFTRK